MYNSYSHNKSTMMLIIETIKSFFQKKDSACSQSILNDNIATVSEERIAPEVLNLILFNRRI